MNPKARKTLKIVTGWICWEILQQQLHRIRHKWLVWLIHGVMVAFGALLVAVFRSCSASMF